MTNPPEAELCRLDPRSQAGQHHETAGLRRSSETRGRKLTLLVLGGGRGGQGQASTKVQ